jgi:hypothetical protein
LRESHKYGIGGGKSTGLNLGEIEENCKKYGRTVPALAKRKHLLGQCLKKQWDFFIKMQTSGHSGGQLNFGGNAEKKNSNSKRSPLVFGQAHNALI